MTEIVKEFHTHAKGEAFGWWGSAIHPAHLDADGKPIKGTEWHENITNAVTLDRAVVDLNNAIKKRHKHD